MDGAHDGVGNQLKDGARERLAREDEEQMERMARKMMEMVKKNEEIKMEKKDETKKDETKDRPEDLEKDGMKAIKEPSSVKCVCGVTHGNEETICCGCETVHNTGCYYVDYFEFEEMEEFVHECVKCRPRLVGREATETRMRVRMTEMLNLAVRLETEPRVAEGRMERVEEEAEEFGRMMRAERERYRLKLERSR